MLEFFNMLLPSEYWKFFTDVAQWDKNDPLVFDKDESNGYFRHCSIGFLWMLRTLDHPLDLDYIITLRNMLYHDDVKKVRGLALDNIISGISEKSITEAGIIQLIEETNTEGAPAYYFTFDGPLDRTIRLWEQSQKDAIHVVDAIHDSVQQDRAVYLGRGHPSRKKEDSGFSFFQQPFSFHVVNDIVQRVNNYLKDYDDDIKKAKTVDEKLTAIVTLVQRLHQFHLFNDGNGRTFCFFLLNRLLVQEDLSPTIVKDPGYFTGWSVTELVDQVKDGQQRFRSLSHPLEISLVDTLKKKLTLTPHEEHMFLDKEFPQEWENIKKNFIRLLAEPAYAREIGGDSERRTGVYTPVHENSSTESTNKFAAEVGLCKKSILLSLPFHLRISLLKQLPCYEFSEAQNQTIIAWLDHLRWLRNYGIDDNDSFTDLEKFAELKNFILILHRWGLHQDAHWQQFILTLEPHENRQEILNESISIFFTLQKEPWFDTKAYIQKLIENPDNRNIFNLDKHCLKYYRQIKWDNNSIALIKTYLPRVSDSKTLRAILSKVRDHQFRKQPNIENTLDTIISEAANISMNPQAKEGLIRNSVFSEKDPSPPSPLSPKLRLI